jgi:lipopolysaccharide transport system permease protein
MNATAEPAAEWDLIIKPKSSLLEIDFKEIWRYRDLLGIFIKREVVFFYKQTILGPLWFLIQPLLTTIIYVILFGKIAQLSTDGKPQILFYLSATVLWNYFADSINSTATTFVTNAGIFGKVYFPRIITPLSKVLSNLIRFGIQFGLFIAIYLYLWATGTTELNITWGVLLIPILLLMMINLGLGLGLLVTSLTTKYKDLVFFFGFAVQLLMYLSPVVYSLASIKNTPYYKYVLLNPISPVIETFRNVLLGGVVDYYMLGYAFVVSTVVLLLGVLVFNKTEKTFIDTI